MFSKLPAWYKSLPSYAIWVMIAIFYFSFGAQISPIKGILLSVLLTPMQFTIYNVNLKFLMPRYYDEHKRKFRLYNILMISFLVLMVGFTEKIFYQYYPSLAPPNKSLIAPFIFHTIFSLMAFWVSMNKYLADKQEKNKVEIETLKREKAESELKFLKTQINPHFLFNALNNIYSMAYTGDESTPEKITMLSDMLRYVLYDCESDMISLYKEVDYINSFLEFQQLKTEKRQNISFDVGSYDENYQIAPMLLVTFVENAFKHSKIEKDKTGFVNIALNQNSEEFCFRVENSIPPKTLFPKTQNKRSIGIENVKNRLNLVYPNKHKLKIINEKNTYKVILKLYK